MQVVIEAHAALVLELYIDVEGQEDRQQDGKGRLAGNDTAQGPIALDILIGNVADSLADGSASKILDGLGNLDLPQRRHGPDDDFIGPFVDISQAGFRQIDSQVIMVFFIFQSLCPS